MTRIVGGYPSDGAQRRSGVLDAGTGEFEQFTRCAGWNTPTAVDGTPAEPARWPAQVDLARGAGRRCRHGRDRRRARRGWPSRSVGRDAAVRSARHRGHRARASGGLGSHRRSACAAGPRRCGGGRRPRAGTRSSSARPTRRGRTAVCCRPRCARARSPGPLRSDAAHRLCATTACGSPAGWAPSTRSRPRRASRPWRASRQRSRCSAVASSLQITEGRAFALGPEASFAIGARAHPPHARVARALARGQAPAGRHAREPDRSHEEAVVGLQRRARSHCAGSTSALPTP